MAAAACEAALPLIQAALSSAGGLAPRDFSGRLFLNIGDEAGLVFSLRQGCAVAELWSGNAAPQADTTIRFDSVDSLRKALQDQSAVPGLLMRRKLRLQGDMSIMSQMGPGDASSNAFVKEFTKELDAAIGGSRGPNRASIASVASLETCCQWVPNEASPFCQECQKAFTTFRRRHHCRFCGRLLCARCAPVVEVGESNCMNAMGQTRHGLRRCDACADGPVPALRSRRESLASLASVTSYAESVGYQESAAEAAMERLQSLKEEVEALRSAEQRRLDYSVSKGILQIWLATYALLGISVLLLCWWRLSVAVAYLCAMLALRNSELLLFRNLRVFWAAGVVTCGMLGTKWKLQALQPSKEDSAAEWDATHQVLARFLYQQILKLKGFWIKLGQQLSVNVVMPKAYREQFGQLQDKITPMPVSDVELTLKEEFGDRAAELSLDKEPLGTASIAQVHRAIWKPWRAAHQEVVVKVQHRNVAQRFYQDLRNAQILSKLLAFVDPEGVPDLRPIVSSLREVTMDELDFRCEAENQKRAREAAEKHGANVLIPKVVPELVSRRAMCMDYVPGESLSKAAKRLSQEQRDRIISAMVDHFAVQFAMDGHFHADPHPGNLLIEQGTDRLVVLDWGMCITLPPEKVHAYAHLFVAAATSNPWSLVEALSGIGITFREGDVFEPFAFLNFVRFGLRDAQPVDEAKGQVEDFMKAGDDLYQRGPKRYRKSPFEVLTGDMTYFLKSLDLLWCVSSQLHTRHPLLETMFHRALAALAPRSPPRLLPALANEKSGRALQDRLRRILEGFYDSQQLLGCQLCVCPMGSPPLVDLAMGVKGWVRQEPVTPSTAFNLLDISKLVTSFVVLDLVRERKLSFSDSLPLQHPVTVEEVLSHTSGYYQPLPPKITELSQLQDAAFMQKAWAEAPVADTDAQQRYCYGSFGYLCSMACDRAGEPLEQAWEKLCQRGAQKAQEMGMECPPLSLTAQNSAQLEGEVTTPDFEEVADMVAHVYVMLGEADDETSRNAGNRDLYGREHLLARSLFNLPDSQSKVMPGLQAYGTARGACALLSAMSLNEDVLRSRKTTLGVEELEEFEPLLNLKDFDNFGLGVQLVSSSYWKQERPPGQVPYQSLQSFIGEQREEMMAWGHLSQNGSFVLVLPFKERPLVVSLLLNLCGLKRSGPQVAKAILRELCD